MKKYILTETGKEVKVGDKITLPKSMVYALFGGRTEVQILLTEEVIPMLVGFHIINVKDMYPIDIEYYIKKAAMHLYCNVHDMADLMNTLLEKMPLTALQLLLKTISFEFTKDVNFAKLSRVYTVNLYDGSIFSMYKCRNCKIAWFDTEDKAKLALKILKPYMEKIYGK